MSLKIRHLLTPLALPVVMTALSIVTASFTAQPVRPAAAEGNRVVIVGADDEQKDSSSRRGYLGVSCQRLRGNLREVLEVPEEVSGVLISDVVDGSPADKAGLRNRDIVVKMNGKALEDERDFTAMIRSAGPGGDITLTIWRAGQTLDLHPTLTSAPREHRDYSWSWSSDGHGEDGDMPRRQRSWSMAPMAPMPPMPPTGIEIPDMPDMKGLSMIYSQGRGRLGVQLQELTPEIAPFFNAPSDKGVLVWKVMEDSPAAKAGVKAGDVIVEVEGKKISDSEDLHEAMSDFDDGDKLAVTVLRRGQSQTLTATLDDGDLNFGDTRALRDLIRTQRGRVLLNDDATPRPGPDGPPMERLQRQMDRLQEQMDRLKEKLDKLKN